MKVDASNLVMMVVNLVGEATSIPTWLILSERRNAPIYRARAIVAYIAHKVMEIPCVEVGRALGRDHSTILHACGVAEFAKEGSDAALIESLSEAARQLRFDHSPEFSVDRLLAAYSALSKDEKISFMSQAASLSIAEAA